MHVFAGVTHPYVCMFVCDMDEMMDEMMDEKAF
jgi:hypothetical protein